MKRTLFYLSVAITGVAIKIGLALCLLGYLPVIPYLAWVGITLVIDLFWYALVNVKEGTK